MSELLRKLRHSTFFAFAFILCATGSAYAEDISQADNDNPPVDLVIALDVSGSMSGLIDSTKQRLWDIVNELAQANPQPDLRMAILTYGNPQYGSHTGYVRIDLPFTRDLDEVNRTLFSFTTEGGDEYVSRVVQRSVTDLDWSDGGNALKILFVAGNEEADQDPQVSIAQATQLAADNGIVVNTIYCGSENDPVAVRWRDFSNFTNGLFASIDQNAAAVANVATPMDEELQQLNDELNQTYVAYGKEGDTYKDNQLAQDKNTAAMSAPSMASRAIAKIGAFYDNAKWDLVDAFKSGEAIEEIEADELPMEMQAMNSAERENYVKDLAKKRETVSQKIKALGEQRQDYISQERVRLNEEGAAGFDTAIIDGLKEIAEAKGLTFDSGE